MLSNEVPGWATRSLKRSRWTNISDWFREGGLAHHTQVKCFALDPNTWTAPPFSCRWFPWRMSGMRSYFLHTSIPRPWGDGGRVGERTHHCVVSGSFSRKCGAGFDARAAGKKAGEASSRNLRTVTCVLGSQGSPLRAEKPIHFSLFSFSTCGSASEGWALPGAPVTGSPSGCATHLLCDLWQVTEKSSNTLKARDCKDWFSTLFGNPNHLENL